MPWRDEVAAVLVSYFGGQEFGNALADVLLGVSEPGGRLPTTWPALEGDVPVSNVTPVDGVVEYVEDIHIGYRAWLRSEVQPAYPFGHGLGYTTWSVDSAEAPATIAEGDTIEVRAAVTNTGTRAGKTVVQVYAAKADSAVDRPVLWLAGFAPAWVEAGATATVTVSIPARTLAYWKDGWQYESGDYTLKVGTSIAELPHEVTVTLS
jgi:beta-glucosidase